MKHDAAGFQRDRHVPLVVGLGCGSLCYALLHRLGVSGLSYLPESGQWSVSPPPDAIAMGYYGAVIYGLVAFGVGASVGKLVLRHMTSSGATKALTGSAAAVTFAAMLYFVVVELARFAGA